MKNSPAHRPDAEELSPAMAKALALVCEGKSQGAVAEAVGVNPKSLRGWMNTPAWRKAEAEIVQGILDGVGTRIASLLDEALDKHRVILRSPTANPKTALTAVELAYKIAGLFRDGQTVNVQTNVAAAPHVVDIDPAVLDIMSAEQLRTLRDKLPQHGGLTVPPGRTIPDEVLDVMTVEQLKELKRQRAEAKADDTD